MVNTAVLAGIFFLFSVCNADDACTGKLIGQLKSTKPNVNIDGQVYAREDTNCFELCKFTYDYEAPDMYLYCDKGSDFTPDGIKLETPETKAEKIGKYVDKRTTACLPKDKKIGDCKIFGLYCFQFGVTFAKLDVTL